MKSNYEERKQARLERAQKLALKNHRKQEEFLKRSSEMASVIPMGQPILVGHHSEKGHRNYLKKIHTHMTKGIEAGNKASYYEDKAEAIENNTAISSDDPNAIEKLEEKLKSLQELQEFWKKCNKIVKNIKLTNEQKINKLSEYVKPETAHRLLLPDFCGRVGFPDYKLQNNNGNMARIKKRLIQLKSYTEKETKEESINGIKIVSNVEANRLQMFFPGKPDESIRKLLKSYGFRWSPSEMAWQRHLSSQAEYYAKIIADLINKGA